MKLQTMQRRDFITLLGGAAAAWPVAVGAQQRGEIRRIGVLMPGTESDQDGQSRVTSFQQGLARLGWTDGRNVQIDYRWAALDLGRMRAFATELVARTGCAFGR